MKIARWILGIVAAFILFILICLFSISYFFGNSISKRIVNELNKNIKTDIAVGKTSFHIISSFPYASLSLYDVKIQNPAISHPSLKVVATIHELSVRFNLIQLIRNKLIIEGLHIEGATFNFGKDMMSHYNYYGLFALKNSHPANFEVKISKIKIVHSNFKYTNVKENEIVAFKIQSILLYGSIGSANNNLMLHSDIEDINISYLNVLSKYLKRVNVGCRVFVSNNAVRVSEGTIISPLVSATFTFDTKADHSFVLAVASNKIAVKNIADAMHLQSDSLHVVSGKMACKAILSGNMQNMKGAVADIKASVAAFGLQFPFAPLPLELTGTVVYRGDIAGNSYNVSTADMKIVYANSNGALSFEATSGFVTKYKGTINLVCADLNACMQLKNTAFTKGTATVAFSGRKAIALHAVDAATIVASCPELKVQTNNLAFVDKSKNIEINNEVTTIEISDNDCFIKSSGVALHNSNFNFTGEILGLETFFTATAPHISVKGSADAESIDVEDLLMLGSDTASKTNISTEVNIDLKADKVLYNKFLFKNVFAHVAAWSNNVHASNLRSVFCGGHISEADISISHAAGAYKLLSSMAFKNIDMTNLFKVFDDFGQQQLQSKNIEGKLSGSVVCNLLMNDAYEVLPASIEATSTFVIRDGRLKEFQPIYKLSTFIDLKELNDIYFDKIQNNISIANRVVTIPYMNISSSALNVTLSGTHTLDNTYTYHFKLLLSDLLFRKANENNKEMSEFGVVEKDTLHRTSVFVKLTGDADNFKASYDTKEAITSFKAKLKSEKQGLKQLLNEEFGIFKNDSIALKDNKKGGANVSKKQKKKVIDDWKDE